MTIFERIRYFGISIEQGFGKRVYNSGTTGAISTDQRDVLSAGVSKDVDDLFDDTSIFGLLNLVARAVILIGEIDGKTLQSGSITESKIATDAAGVDRFFTIFDNTVKIVIPIDALI